MTDSRPDHEYVVLTESGKGHWVCVRRAAEPGWLQVVAGFMDRDRAESYAEVENLMLDDDPTDPRKDGVTEAPKLELPPGNVERFRAWFSGEGGNSDDAALPAPADDEQDDEAVPEQEDAGPPAESDDEPGDEEAPGQAGAIPDLILRLLPDFMEKHEGGPNIKQVAAVTRLPEADVREAFNELRAGKRATVWQPHSGAPLQVAPLGFEAPTKPELSENQVAVLDYLAELPPGEGGTIEPPSYAKISDATGVPTGSLGAAISDLERKGKIEVVRRGKPPFITPRYRVVERTLLAQAASEPDGPRDASSLVFDDPPFERSALAERLKRQAAGESAP